MKPYRHHRKTPRGDHPRLAGQIFGVYLLNLLRVRRSLDAKTSLRSRITPRLKSCLDKALKAASGKGLDNSRVPRFRLPSEIKARAATRDVILVQGGVSKVIQFQPPLELRGARTSKKAFTTTSILIPKNASKSFTKLLWM